MKPKALYTLFVIAFYVAAAYITINYVLPWMQYSGARSINANIFGRNPNGFLIGVLGMGGQMGLTIFGPILVALWAITAGLANLLWAVVTPEDAERKWYAKTFAVSALMPPVSFIGWGVWVLRQIFGLLGALVGV